MVRKRDGPLQAVHIKKKKKKDTATVSCSVDGAWLAGVGFGYLVKGKPRRAWHWCIGGACYLCPKIMPCAKRVSKIIVLPK